MIIGCIFRRLFFPLACMAIFPAIVSAQNRGDSSMPQFRDDLLDKLEGEWTVKAIAHDFPSTAVVEAKWVLHHQFFEMHFMGEEAVPWIGVPMEFHYFFGYQTKIKKYIAHWVSVFGSEDSDGVYYGQRIGNELTLELKEKINPAVHVIQRLRWDPATQGWEILASALENGKEGVPFLKMTLEKIKISVEKAEAYKN